MTQEQGSPRIGDFQPPDRKTQRPPRQEGDAENAEDRYGKPPKGGSGVQQPKTQIPEGDAEAEAKQRASLYEKMAEGLTPIEDYQAFLKQMDISLEEAQDIVDSLFTQGYYEEKVKLTKRLHAVLRTRQHGDTLRLQTALEVQRPIFQHVMEEVTARYNLAASLVQYGEKTLPVAEEDATKEKVEEVFDERLTFVEKMADPAFYKLTTLLAKLDQKVAAVMREGVAENF
jgi:hypothetical protein